MADNCFSTPGLIGVVTVTYNSAPVLPDFLQSVANQTHTDFRLYAVDNASTDSSLEQLRDWGDPRLIVVANRDNRGVAQGNNQGIRAALAAGCTSILLLNNDTVFESNLFAKLVAGLHDHQADMICPKMLHFDEPSRIWAAGGYFQWWFGYRSVHRGANELDQGQYSLPADVTYVPTCCVLIRASAFRKVGLMDEKYFVYMDDVDFMYRAHKHALSLIYLPTASLLHKEGGSTGGRSSAFTIRYIARNRIYFLRKHFGLLRMFPWLFLYQTYYFVRFLFVVDDWNSFSTKQRALLDGLMLTHP